MQGWSVLCSGRFDRVMLLLLHREGATSGRQQKTTSPRACGPSEGEADYPRVCGATIESTAEGPQGEGLSPRVRGNRHGLHVLHAPPGPIPACAGQPEEEQSQKTNGRAYPRVCGATGSGGVSLPLRSGLSPRVRGNRCWPRASLSALRPIPACAGQPQTVISNFCFIKAYPRVCGATMLLLRLSRIGVGLSPRVRGNRGGVQAFAPCPRPIPACAGQPIGVPNERTPLGAYPRVCGATHIRDTGWMGRWGLSPRVRGNLLQGASL